MIEYFDALPEEEQLQLTQLIQTLLKQTFVLERKYDRRTGRFLFNREYRVLSKHLEFLKEYFRVSGIQIQENVQNGVIYLTGEPVMAERLTKLSTIYLLILKLIYDEQMASASTSVNIYTTLGEINERMGSFHLWRDRPSLTEIRRTLTLLKRYQIVEVLDPIDDVEADTRLIVYPCINMVLMGENARMLLESFTEEEETERVSREELEHVIEEEESEPVTKEEETESVSHEELERVTEEESEPVSGEEKEETEHFSKSEIESKSEGDMA